ASGARGCIGWHVVGFEILGSHVFGQPRRARQDTTERGDPVDAYAADGHRPRLTHANASPSAHRTAPADLRIHAPTRQSYAKVVFGNVISGLPANSGVSLMTSWTRAMTRSRSARGSRAIEP